MGDLVARGIGRPRGSRDLHGRARRVDDRRVDIALRELCIAVRDARIAQGISVSELAEAVGTGASAIHRLERMRTSPYVRTLIRVAHALGVMPYELLQ